MSDLKLKEVEEIDGEVGEEVEEIRYPMKKKTAKNQEWDMQMNIVIMTNTFSNTFSYTSEFSIF